MRCPPRFCPPHRGFFAVPSSLVPSSSGCSRWCLPRCCPPHRGSLAVPSSLVPSSSTFTAVASSSLVPAYGMPYRSLHRSAQEAAMWPNSRAQRRIRWASRRSATAPQPRMPSAEAHPNLKHARWTSTTRVQDAIQKPPSTGAGRRGAAQLQGAAAHPLSAQARRDGTSAPDAIGGSPSQACAVDTRNLLTGYRAEAAPFR